MLTKQQFLTSIDMIIKEQKAQDKFDEALREYAPSDFTGFCKENFFPSIQLLEDMMDDKHGVISWWFFETDCGERKDMINIWEKDDPKDKPTWKIETPEDLYAYLFITYGKTPSQQELKSLLFQQEQGFKFTLNQIDDLRKANEKTQNEGWEARDNLFQYLLTTLPTNYTLATGIKHIPTLDEGVFLVSILDNEKDTDDQES